MADPHGRTFDGIPLYAVPETEDSDVIEYETNVQRDARLLRERLIECQAEEMARLQIQMTQTWLAASSAATAGRG